MPEIIVVAGIRTNQATRRECSARVLFEGNQLIHGECTPAEASCRRALGRMSFPKIAHVLNIIVRRLFI